MSGPQPSLYLYLGAKHMVTGLDHVLFLVGVVFFLPRLKDVVLWVSLFTIGHSLTLIGGVLLSVGLNAYVVDAISRGHRAAQPVAPHALLRPKRLLCQCRAKEGGRHPHRTKYCRIFRTMSTESTAAPASRTKIIIGIIVALVIAAVALVFFILPAERGVDLTRSGKTTGLTNLAEAGEMTELERGALREGVFTPSDQALRTDRWERELAPYEAVEFKYTMENGQPMIFSWRTTAPVNYDMHSHPFEGGEDMTESYGVGDGQAMHGLYVAPFTGIHGWYWQNRTLDNVTLTLETSGGFTHSTIFEDGSPQERPISGEKAAPTRLPEGHRMQNPDEG